MRTLRSFLLLRALRAALLVLSLLVCAPPFHVQAQTSCVQPPSGLISWWRLSDGSDDTLRNAGVVVGSADFVAGEVGTAIYSANGRVGVVVSNSASLNFGAGADFSIEAWVQPLVANTTYGVEDIVDKRVTPSISSALGYEFALVNGQLVFQDSDSFSGALTTVGPAGPDLRDGAWHHVAVTIHRGASDGGTLYVDGLAVLKFDTTRPSGSLSSSAPLLIGLHPTYPTVDGDFRGGIDEVAIYSRALSAAEIMSIYASGSAGKCSVNPPVLGVATYAGLTITGAVGHTYGVEYSTSLDPSNWLPLGSVTLTDQVQLWFDTNAISGPQRLYRVVTGP